MKVSSNVAPRHGNGSRSFRCLAAAASLAAVFLPIAGAAAEPGPLLLGKQERLLVIAPHPDDESLGAAGLIQRVLAGGGRVQVLLVTAGDANTEALVHETKLRHPRPEQYVAYGQRRFREARAAVHEFGRAVDLDLLGFPDGGLDALLHRHWQRIRPLRSATTKASDPPYAEARNPDVPYDGLDLELQLLQVLREFRPTLVALPDPLDRHPDHRASALFFLLALDDWSNEAAGLGGEMPRLLAYLIHWPDWPPGWDTSAPRPSAAEQAIDFPPSFPTRNLSRLTLALTPAERAKKNGALARHQSQQTVMRSFLAAFVRRNEIFSLLPAPSLRKVRNMIERSGRTAQALPIHGAESGEIRSRQ